MAPDINILNFQLRWQNFSGSFDTTRGSCTGCKYDLSNATCQAEIEKIWGMFLSYNLTINLTIDSGDPNNMINMTDINMICRSINDTQAYAQGGNPPADCSGLSIYGIDPDGSCFTPIAGVPGSYLGSNGVVIPLNGTLGLAGQIGTIMPTAACEQIACEINGTWVPGNTQEFTVNKTITVTAN